MNINKKNTALLVIDIINMCCSPKCEDVEYELTYKKIRRMVPKLDKFVESYAEFESDWLASQQDSENEKEAQPKKLVKKIPLPKKQLIKKVV